MTAEWVAYGGRLSVKVPKTITVHYVSPDKASVDHLYTMDLDIDDGRLVCIHLAIDRSDDGPPVTPEAIRNADIVDWIADEAVASNLVWDRTEDSRGNVSLDFHRPPAAGFNTGGMTDHALDLFSQHYAYLMVTGQRPSGVFLRDYSMARPTVTRWAQTARDRRILVDEHERIEYPQ